MATRKGVLIISLDFELNWGVRDEKEIAEYGTNLIGAREAVPALLKLFNEYGIHATWATVGFLFFANRVELTNGLPGRKPTYVKSNLSPYPHITGIGFNEDEDPFHYASSLIKMIKTFPHQEIGTHTFSHYYCLEDGQDIVAFKADLATAFRVAQKKYLLTLESLVFPRNQYNSEYISICREKGIKAYRGNEPSWVYHAKSNREYRSLVRRCFRFMDAYLNISGHNAYSLDMISSVFPFNIPSSRFLRPYARRLRILEPLRLRRILTGLEYAAKKGFVYHLWWHPHNFGADLDQNMSFLKKILDYFIYLQEAYGMESLNMRELTARLIKKWKA